MKRGGRREPHLAPPSPAAFAALGPYARTRIVERALGQTLALDVPADVFSHQRVDDGTLLLLEHLPAAPPGSVLDLGCGYGALGLPIAARFAGARCLLVDRDLLAVAASAHNARALALGNVEVRPGLGYRGVGEKDRFDWVLCNVPARIGSRAIRYLLEGGRTLGDVRVVVIRDLGKVVEGLALDGLERIADGPRHTVFALPHRAAAVDLSAEDVYDRDETSFEGLRLSRPHDASEDPAHLKALGILAQSLPRASPSRVLAFRSGYGSLPLLAKNRWPEASITAQDRDLLDTAFVRRNALRLGLPVEVRETLFPADGLEKNSFALVLGELSPSAGAAVAARELQDAADLLVPGGEALVLASEKMEREWLPAAAPKKVAMTLLLRRDGVSILRISRARAR